MGFNLNLDFGGINFKIVFGVILIVFYILLFTNTETWIAFGAINSLILAILAAGLVAGITIFLSKHHRNTGQRFFDFLSIGRKGNRKEERKIVPISKPEHLKILVGTDGSENAEKAVKYATHLAVKNKGEVILLYVVATDTRIPPSPWITPEIEFRDKKFLEGLKEVGESILRNEASIVTSKGINALTRIEFGDPAEQILRIADEANIDVLVLGARGASFWKNLVIGSVSERVIDGTRIPVLVVR
jgi:nucleotide-binding universal stress UspA family protein